MQLNLPTLAHFKDCQRILIAGMGGGFVVRDKPNTWASSAAHRCAQSAMASTRECPQSLARMTTVRNGTSG